MKRIAIIDVNHEARQLLRKMLEFYCPDVQVCGEATGIEDGFTLIRQTNPIGVLLAITLKDGTGFDLLDRFPRPVFRVIFTSPEAEFALKAFRYRALDYLLEPINPVELSQAMDRLDPTKSGFVDERVNDLTRPPFRSQSKITLHCLEGLIFLPLDQIIHLESDGCYTTFFMTNFERHIVSRPLKDFEDLLPGECFFRVHQSHLIRLAYVRKILRENGGYAVMEDGYKVPIARRRKMEFLARVQQLFSP